MKADTNKMLNGRYEISQGNGYLKSAKTVATRCATNVPSDFYYYEKVKKLPKNFEEMCEDCNSIEKWISETVSNIKDVENKAKSLLWEKEKIEIDAKIEAIKEQERKERERPYIEKAIDYTGKELKKTGASITNEAIAVSKGIAKFGESVVDTGAIFVTGLGTVGTGIHDFVTGDNSTERMVNNTMSFVAEDHVENAFKDFYQNNSVGKALDEYAYEPFKSDGTATKVTTELGYVGGIAVTTIATGGVAGVGAGVTAGIGAGVTTVSGTGRYTAEYWEGKRDASWEGIERAYKNGQISLEQLNTFKAIRSLNSEQWKEIENDYKNGKISKEEFEQIKAIKEMPEDWKTAENAIKGLGYGLTNGAWEGLQWYVGGKLATTSIKGLSKVENSAVRVGVDTVFNAADTGVRAGTDVAFSGKSWEQAWKDQGGWKSVATNAGIGLIGSTAGEKVDIAKVDKAMKDINESTLFKNLDKKIADKLKIKLMNDYIAGKISINNKTIAKYVANPSQYIDQIQTIDDAIRLTLTKQGKEITAENIQSLKNKINNGDYSGITRTNGARDFVAAYMHPEDINISTIDDAITVTLMKQKKAITAENIQSLKNKINNGDYSGITRTNGARDFVAAKMREKHTKRTIAKEQQVPKIKTLDDLFEKLEKNSGKYGVDQGRFYDFFFFKAENGKKIKMRSGEYKQAIGSNSKLQKMGTPEYFEIKNIIKNKYNMSAKDASLFMTALDSKGACSYASVANDIVGHFSDKPELFESIFGFPLYKKTKNGKLKLNDAELLADMYMFANNKKNGGNLFKTNSKGETTVIKKSINIDKYNSAKIVEQKYMSFSTGINKRLVNKYLSSKTKKLQVKTGLIGGTKLQGITGLIGGTRSNEEMKKIIKEAKRRMNNGEQLSMGVYKNKRPINFVDMKTNQVYCSTFGWDEGDGHAVKITKIRDDGFVVSTWGKKCLVLYSDLQYSGAFDIEFMKFNLKN